ncbi:hypothetical protein [Pedobacter sp. BMA]|uniref:hypothetical protein n=1 Tax=Pedobacter sp. BMA TaxID=1663685 RepID=UPI0006589514|nr:hypothetical protein [Pedobacter sp. BMA]KLT63631.1 hypothetical protein AB669_21195 [Pedobacter sp. BMA]
MKTIFTLFFLVMSISVFAQSKQNASNSNLEIATALSDVNEEIMPVIAEKITAKIEHNELYENSKGMMIYPKFKIDNRCGKEVILKVKLYREGNSVMQCMEDQALQLSNEGDPFIFIPYCSLNLEKNKVHKIRFEVQAYCQGKLLKRSTSYRAIINML